MLISPGYQYESVERDIFLTRQDIQGASSSASSRSVEDGTG